MDLAGSCENSFQVHDTTLYYFTDAGRSRKVLLLEVVWGTKSKCAAGKGACSWK
jgi:hypothetical protein